MQLFKLILNAHWNESEVTRYVVVLTPDAQHDLLERYSLGRTINAARTDLPLDRT
jgi:hypothetical protein